MKIHTIYTALLLLGLLLCFGGCEEEDSGDSIVLSEEAVSFMRQVEDDAEQVFHLSKRIENLEIEVWYQPVLYSFFLEVQEGFGDEAAYDRVLEEREGLYALQLCFRSLKEGVDVLSIPSLQDVAYPDRLAYFEGAMQENLFLDVGGELLECDIYFAEELEGGEACFSLVFGPAESPSKSLSFIFDDNTFGVGRMRLSFDRKMLDRIPAFGDLVTSS